MARSEVAKLRADFESKYVPIEDQSKSIFKELGANALKLIIVAKQYNELKGKSISLIKFLDLFFTKEDFGKKNIGREFLNNLLEQYSQEDAQTFFVTMRYSLQDYPKKKVGSLTYKQIYDFLIDNELYTNREFLSVGESKLDKLCKGSDSCFKAVKKAIEDIFLGIQRIPTPQKHSPKRKSPQKSKSPQWVSPTLKKPTYKQLKAALAECEARC